MEWYVTLQNIISNVTLKAFPEELFQNQFTSLNFPYRSSSASYVVFSQNLEMHVRTNFERQILYEKEISKLFLGYQRRQRSTKRFGDMTSSNGDDRARLWNVGFGSIFGECNQPGV